MPYFLLYSAVNTLKTFKQDYAKLTENPDSQMLMAELPEWFDDCDSHHPHSTLSYLLANFSRAKRKVKHTEGNAI